MKKQPPKSGTVTIGKTPAWELWAETQIEQAKRGQELLAKGCFTIGDFAKKSGWGRDRAASFLDRGLLKHEIAQDPRSYNARPVRFYFPPGVRP